MRLRGQEPKGCEGGKVKVLYGRDEKNSVKVARLEWEGPGWYACGTRYNGQEPYALIQCVGKSRGPEGREVAERRARELCLGSVFWATCPAEALWPYAEEGA